MIKISLHAKILVLSAVLVVENAILAFGGLQDLSGLAGKAALAGGVLLAAYGAATFLHFLSGRQRMSEVLQLLGTETEQLKTWISRISGGAGDLSQGTAQQAGSLQRTASSIEEMSAMVTKSAENAKRSREVATTSLQTANHGKVSVEKMIDAIEDINRSNNHIVEQINQSNGKITEIVKVISEIGSKTKVINDIVFQTKLLSFNASVEAARAGEHGKGFAVVAEEVGNLAQMSGNAAREIGDLLSGSIQKVENIVSETKDMVERLVETGKSKVDAGTIVARQCGQVLEEVVKNVTEANLMIGEISNAAEEQALGIKEIKVAVTQLDGVTRKNKDTSQESATLCSELMERADGVHRHIAELRQSLGNAEDLGGARSYTSHFAPVASHMPAPARQEQVNVIPFKPAPASRKRGRAADPDKSQRTSAGGEDVPLENDPRFKEI